MLVQACSSTDQVGYLIDMPDGEVSMSPIEQTKDLTLFAKGNAFIIKRYISVKQIDTPIDIVLLYDRTASMKGVIDETGEVGNQIVKDIKIIMPNARFAVASIADYNVFSPDLAEDEVFQLLSDFNQSPKVLELAIKAIKIANGGDSPEAYTRGFYEVSKLNWRKKAKKLVIFFGDSIPHAPDPGEDGRLNTHDDLNWHSTVQLVKSKDIQVVGIHTNTYPEVLNIFQFITQHTNGKMFLLDDANQVSKIIKKSIYGAFVPEISLQASGINKQWVQSIQLKEDFFGDDIQVQVQLKVPENTPTGVYPIQIELSTSTISIFAKYNIESDQRFTINAVTGWYNSYFIPLLPLLALLLLLLYFFLRARRGCRVNSSAIYTLDRHYSLSKLLIDFLFLIALLGVVLWTYLYTKDAYLSQLMNKF